MNKLKCFILVVLLVSQYRCEAEMRLLQIVFHNGQRDHGQASRPHRDPYRVFWQTGPGRIAMMGLTQLFGLGQRIRRKYSDFVTVPPDEASNYPIEMKFRNSESLYSAESDDVHLKSIRPIVNKVQVDLQAAERAAPCGSITQCFLSGFSKPNNEPPPLQLEMPPPEIQQNMVPDEKLNEPELKCPKLQEAASRLYDDSEEGNRIIGENMNLYQYWTENSGMDIRNPTDARELYETLQLEKSLNASLPSWVDRFWPELKRQSDIHFDWLSRNQHMQRLAAGPLLGLIIHRMEKHIQGYDLKKYFIYPGKNSSLAGLLAIFGAFDGSEPPFGSTVVLELHRFGRVYYVRVLYFYSKDAPEIITLKGCYEYCPFDKFRLLTTGMVPLRWEQECGLWKDKGSRHAETTSWLYFATGLMWMILFTFSY